MSGAIPCFRWLTLSAMVLLACSRSAVAQNCRNETISRISADAIYLYTNSGEVFQFLGQDFIDPRVDWHAGEEISICKNTGVDGADVFVVKNFERGESLKVSRQKEGSD
jgi:hypothetical protein